MAIISNIKLTYALLNKEQRKKTIICAICSLLNSILETFALILIYPMILILMNQTDGKTNLSIPFFSDYFDVNEQPPLIFIGLAVFLTYLFKNTFYTAYTWWQLGFVKKTARQLSTKLVENYIYSPYVWRQNKNTTQLQRNANNSVNSVFNTIFLPALNTITELFVVIGILFVLFSLEPVVVSILILILILVSAIYYFAFKRIAKNTGHQLEISTFGVIKSLHQALGCITDIRLFNRVDNVVEEYSEIKQEEANASRMMGYLSLLPRVYLEIVLAFLIVIGVLWIGQLENPEHGIAVLGVFVAAAFRLTPSITRVLTSIQNINTGTSSLKNVSSDIFELEKNSLNKNNNIENANFICNFEKIEMRNVSYRYASNEEYRLSDISLNISANQCLGIVGGSGSGKTTLVNILIGLLKPTEGEVFLNGKRMPDDISHWNGLLGYVPQSIYLLDDTIAQNIAVGIDKDQIEHDKLWSALRLAHLEDYVNTLEQGVETQVGERGVKMSGGQKQRIGIARALYTNPDILVMDEGTSALDNLTEASITNAINDLKGNKTIILIAHRLSTVKNCDQIIFMKEGQIINSGKFSELIKTNPDFEQLVNIAKTDNS